MLITYETEREYRNQCREKPINDIWIMYDDLTTLDDNYNNRLYSRIEEGLIKWVEDYVIAKVFYEGDLDFMFECVIDRDLFDKECGDAMAFKLTWT